MANVLPPEKKKILAARLRARFIFTTAVVLCAGALVAALALVPAFVSVRIALSSLPESEVSETARDDQAKGARAAALVAALGPISHATSSAPVESVTAALALKPAGMSISGVRYSKGKIELSGVAANRAAVSVFRDALEADARFTTVAVPVAALVGTQEGRFTITLSGAF